MIAHRLAELFPLMGDDEFAAFVADIRQHGLREPIILLDGAILDGRNRHRACIEAGVQLRTRVLEHGDPLAFVLSANLKRRHLNESQRAMVAARIANLGEGRPAKTVPNGRVSRSHAAAGLNVGERTVARARIVLDKAAPEIVAAVERGKITVAAAADVADLPRQAQREIAANPKRAPTAAKQHRRAEREAELSTRIRQAANSLDTGQRYGIIYADPPWRFAPYSTDTGMDRAADNHYPTMTTDEIAAMAVPAAADCALFLWATVPMLPEALRVMAAWGFSYRSACAWYKSRPGTGYWFRNTMELLLVGTRGEVPAPAPGQQFDQVIRCSPLRHSEKPAAFAEMIEELFPTTPRIELFAREPRLGWATWGTMEADNAR